MITSQINCLDASQAISSLEFEGITDHSLWSLMILNLFFYCLSFTLAALNSSMHRPWVRRTLGANLTRFDYSSGSEFEDDDVMMEGYCEQSHCAYHAFSVPPEDDLNDLCVLDYQSPLELCEEIDGLNDPIEARFNPYDCVEIVTGSMLGDLGSRTYEMVEIPKSAKRYVRFTARRLSGNDIGQFCISLMRRCCCSETTRQFEL